MIRPFSSSSRNFSHVAQRPTRLLFAISTRGALACVRKTATGLPLCTSSVSSCSSSRSACDDGVEALPVARRLARAAVHRRDRPGARRLRDRDCSSACGARPPAAIPCRRACSRAAREPRAAVRVRRARSRSSRSYDPSSVEIDSSPSAIAPRSAAMSPAKTRSCPQRLHELAHRWRAPRRPSSPAAAARGSPPPCAAHSSSIASTFAQFSTTRRSFHAAPMAIGTTSSLLPSVRNRVDARGMREHLALARERRGRHLQHHEARVHAGLAARGTAGSPSLSRDSRGARCGAR